MGPSREQRMGRIREYIRVNGKKFWTLFDSGARNTYIVPAVAAHLTTTKLPKAFRSSLGGGVKKATHGAILTAEHLDMWPAIATGSGDNIAETIVVDVADCHEDAAVET